MHEAAFTVPNKIQTHQKVLAIIPQSHNTTREIMPSR